MSPLLSRLSPSERIPLDGTGKSVNGGRRRRATRTKYRPAPAMQPSHTAGCTPLESSRSSSSPNPHFVRVQPSKYLTPKSNWTTRTDKSSHCFSETGLGLASARNRETAGLGCVSTILGGGKNMPILNGGKNMPILNGGKNMPILSNGSKMP